jgi:hypothetical protein
VLFVVVTALPTPHREREHRIYTIHPCYFQSIKSGFSCSIVFLAPQPIKSFDRAGVVDRNTIPTTIVDESGPSDCVSSLRPSLFYLLRNCFFCFSLQRSIWNERKRGPSNRKKKRTRSPACVFVFLALPSTWVQ